MIASEIMLIRIFGRFRQMTADASSIYLCLLVTFACTSQNSIFGASPHPFSISAFAATVLAIYGYFKSRTVWSKAYDPVEGYRLRSRRIAGLLFVLSIVVETALVQGNHTTTNDVWVKTLTPLAVCCISWLRYGSDRCGSGCSTPVNHQPSSSNHIKYSKRILLVATVSASLVSQSVSPISLNSIALALAGSCVTGVAYYMLVNTISDPMHEQQILGEKDFLPIDEVASANVESGHANGIFDVATAMAPVLAILACVFELGPLTDLVDIKMMYKALPAALPRILLDAVRTGFLISSVATHGPLSISLLGLMAVAWIGILAPSGMNLDRIANAILASLAAVCASTHIQRITPGAKHIGKSVFKHIVMWLSVFVFGLYLIKPIVQNSTSPSRIDVVGEFPRMEESALQSHQSILNAHPIKSLVALSNNESRTTRTSQSNSLEDAIEEYQRRYQLFPPPSFDKWYDFAKARNFELVDEFDAMQESLLPFWALKPINIRARVREAIGHDKNDLMAIIIRDGRAVRVQGGQKWQQEATLGMLESFIHILPDMDLAFNTHDEPRIVVPHDELSQMVDEAKEQRVVPKAVNRSRIKKAFSSSPQDFGDGRRIQEFRSTRFNRYDRQANWAPSRLSCSPNSPARDMNDEAIDDQTASTSGPLGIIKNVTAFSDVCMSPTFKQTHGFFERPNSLQISHDLIPIFSQSKVSSFQDILFPSPWYWYGRLPLNQTEDMHINHVEQYDENKDLDWEKKMDKLWWRGSTTGGYSRRSGWRQHHRQNLVRKIDALGNATILSQGSAKNGTWRVSQTRRQDFRDLIDVHFTGVGQCDPGDCAAQSEYFNLSAPVDMQETWKSKFLLDMDGNAFSGRFYSLLRSKSQVFKVAIFREWHADRLIPWVHYVPLSLSGDEVLESVRYFAQDEEGAVLAKTMAAQSRDWARRALRREDMEVWFFRLLLEYGRLIDDDRANLGFWG